VNTSSDAVEARTARSGWIIAAGTALLIVVMVLAGGRITVENHARDALRRDLNALSPPYLVTVNARETTSPDVIVNALRSVARVAPHHSGPMQPLELEIRDATHTLHVRLAPDSSRPDEFWVFQNSASLFAGLLGLEVGRVTDSRLPGLLLARVND
jgi:hypothetical protein